MHIYIYVYIYYNIYHYVYNIYTPTHTCIYTFNIHLQIIVHQTNILHPAMCVDQRVISPCDVAIFLA